MVAGKDRFKISQVFPVWIEYTSRFRWFVWIYVQTCNRFRERAETNFVSQRMMIVTMTAV